MTWHGKEKMYMVLEKSKVSGSWVIHDNEIKMEKEEWPGDLSWIQFSGCLEIFHVLMVCYYPDRMMRPLQRVLPLLEGYLDHKELPVPNVINPFRGSQDPGMKGIRVQLLGVSEAWDRLVPMVQLKESTSTKNSFMGSRFTKTDAEVKALSSISKTRGGQLFWLAASTYHSLKAALITKSSQSQML